MPRPKIYDTSKIPASAAKVAKAVCADYDRRAHALERKSIPADVHANLSRLNKIVDDALSEIVEPGVRADILRDLVARRGWERSRARGIIYERGYYARRNLVLRRVAEQLKLI